MDGRAPIDRTALARIMPVYPNETDAQLLAVIERTLYRWRLQGLAGHWAYDKAKHENLLAFYCQVTGASHDEWKRINHDR